MAKAKESTQKYQVVGSDAWINKKYYAENSIIELTPEDYERRKKVLVPVATVEKQAPEETITTKEETSTEEVINENKNEGE
jgi:hypothetical protein